MKQARQKKTNIIGYHLYGESEKDFYKLTYKHNKKTLTDIESKFMVTKGEGGVRDKLGVWD